MNQSHTNKFRIAHVSAIKDRGLVLCEHTMGKFSLEGNGGLEGRRE